jgi:hypothetical protein
MEKKEEPGKRYFKYWGKARKKENGEGYDYHLLPYHCLDVAAITGWTSRRTRRAGTAYMRVILRRRKGRKKVKNEVDFVAIMLGGINNIRADPGQKIPKVLTALRPKILCISPN